ncbi:MAG: flagellar hook-length control protein FliK [Rhodocyclaceae bacterium]|nr:flagellar hook-length control protein FliK [Rhodocyclaceae bacterium]
MALIPPDVGVRMRLPGDGPLQPVAPVPGIPAELLDLQPGQVFSARIQEVLPENTYRALVAGKTVTLALPEGAESGDVLELVVIDRNNKAILARTVPDGAAGTEAYKHTTLSPTAQLIGQLLSEEPGGTQAMPLNRGQALLNAPPTNAAPLATALQKAVEGSGLFYEAHQAQWIAGKRPLESLLQEPQGQRSDRAEAEAAPTATRASSEAAVGGTAVRQELLKAANDAIPARAAAETAQAAVRGETQTMPAELRPLVQQQLEAAANQRLVWHGEAWPGQRMEWEVEEDQRQTARSTEEPQPWLTTLRLTTPRLGSVEARLRIAGNSLQLNLSTPVGASAADMRDELPALTQALAAAGIDLQSAQVRHESE